MHGAAEDHHRVPGARVAEGGLAVRDDPPVELVTPFDDGSLEDPAAARHGPVVDDRARASGRL
jgi:hypothetical protein